MNLLVNLAILSIFTFQLDVALTEETDRDKKILPVFQVVRFPNDPCVISGGTKNGTCYTAEECSNKKGVNGGSCASGFGVCCTITGGCGSSSSENCTYFEVTGASAGPCSHQVCKCNDNICQIRLDFDSFVITGPSTNTDTIGKQTHGVLDATIAAGKLVSSATQCLTDTFSVSGDTIVPTLCGTLSGEHIYFDLKEECHKLDFNFGQSANGVAAAEPNRRFNVKISQIECTSTQKAPTGCLQYHTGSATEKGSIKTFNYDQGYHLATQRQTICFRREQGNCKVCFSAELDADVQLSGKNAKGVTKASSCCGYDADGLGSDGVFDCLQIPGAEKATAAAALIKEQQCGGKKGLVTASDGASKTVCSKVEPFQIAFISDEFELSEAATEVLPTPGFKLTYFQQAC